MASAAAQLVAVQRALASLESAAAAGAARAASARAAALAASEDVSRFEAESKDSLERQLVDETRAGLAEAAAAEAEEKANAERKELKRRDGGEGGGSGSGSSFRERFEGSQRATRSHLLDRVRAFASKAEDLWQRSCPSLKAKKDKEAEEEAARSVAKLEGEQAGQAARKGELEAARARVSELRERLSAVTGGNGGGSSSGGDDGGEASLRESLARLKAWESASFHE
jgi:hypothetical protein